MPSAGSTSHLSAALFFLSMIRAYLLFFFPFVFYLSFFFLFFFPTKFFSFSFLSGFYFLIFSLPPSLWWTPNSEWRNCLIWYMSTSTKLYIYIHKIVWQKILCLQGTRGGVLLLLPSSLSSLHCCTNIDCDCFLAFFEQPMSHVQKRGLTFTGWC